MARRPIEFSDEEMRGIMAAAEAAHCAAPKHNDDFLGIFIDGVARSTGRLYGQTIYERLLVAVGLSRRPSAQTWMKALARIRAVGVPPRSENLPRPDKLPQREPKPSDSSAPGMALVTAVAPGPLPKTAEAVSAGATVQQIVEWKSRMQIAESAARDAYARIAALEAERDRLIGLASAAEANVRSLTERLELAQRDHKEDRAALLARDEARSADVARFAGVERHLRLQTDQLRQELARERDRFKARAEAAEKALTIERGQTDAMRRVLGNRTQQFPDGTPEDYPLKSAPRLGRQGFGGDESS